MFITLTEFKTEKELLVNSNNIAFIKKWEDCSEIHFTSETSIDVLETMEDIKTHLRGQK